MAQRDIEAQVTRLEQLKTKYVNRPELLVAVEQALASAYVARELDGIKQFLNGLTVLKEKV